MNKFDYDLMANDEITTVCFNKNKYTKNQAFKLGVEELRNFGSSNYFKIRTGYIRFGFNSSDDGLLNGWNIDFNQTERKTKNEVEVWVVEGVDSSDQKMKDFEITVSLKGNGLLIEEHGKRVNTFVRNKEAVLRCIKNYIEMYIWNDKGVRK